MGRFPFARIVRNNLESASILVYIFLMKKFWIRVLDILGLRRNSKYVSKHLEDANMRSGIYMAAIIVIIEVWMIIRRLVEDVPERMIPAAQGGPAHGINLADSLYCFKKTAAPAQSQSL